VLAANVAKQWRSQGQSESGQLGHRKRACLATAVSCQTREKHSAKNKVWRRNCST
jgi:hypothetical protein